VTVRASLGLLRERAFARLVVAVGALGLLTVSDGFIYLSLLHRDIVAAVFPLSRLGPRLADSAVGKAVTWGVGSVGTH
jgi:hypothetical protein